MIAKRILDLVLVIFGVFFISPLMLFIAIAIKLDSHGGVLFKQTRVGLNGKLFKVLKFRTMHTNAEAMGAKITVGGDPRITSVGNFLRHYKLDELPQLFNVLRGEMSLVGPRPEVPEYVEFYPEGMKEIVLSVLPGMTDRASIEYRDESAILENATNPLKEYRETILPVKLDYYKDYVNNRSLITDISLIFQTFYVILRKPDESEFKPKELPIE